MKLFIASLLLLGAVATVLFAATEAPKKPALIINMTSGTEDLHSVWMGLQLAEHGLDDGRNVVVFLNVHAPTIATKDLAGTLRFKESPSVAEQIAILQKKGGSVITCPACLKVNGHEKEDLIAGVTLADREKLFGPLTPGSVVFTY